MIEIRRNGFSVSLNEDAFIEIHRIPTLELAIDINRVLHQAYCYGTQNPYHAWTEHEDDE